MGPEPEVLTPCRRALPRLFGLAQQRHRLTIQDGQTVQVFDVELRALHRQFFALLGVRPRAFVSLA